MIPKIYNKSYWITETDPEVLKKAYEEILKQSGFTTLGFIEYQFQPEGYTAIFLLAESHFAIHTFPEEGKTYIELSSCTEEYFNNFKQIEGLN